MIGRKLSIAAKQLLSSSSIHIGLFHTNNIPQQISKCGQKEVSANPPPRALIGELEKPNSQKRTDSDDKRPLYSSWRPPWRVTQDDAEEEKKKKKKKRGPPGPIEFESLTSTTAVHSDLPFAFRYSYTEIPKVPAVGFQEKFSPFGPGRLDRAWDGQQAVPLPSSSSSSTPPSAALSSSSTLSDNSVMNMKNSKYTFKGVRLINPPSPYLSNSRPRKVRTREEVLGEPLTLKETKELVENASKHKTRRQINMGRDGLTHNMLIEIQDHWKREPVVRIRCKGVCTVDMNNVLFQLEDKTGGKIIHRLGGTVYLFRGRNFRYKDRSVIPPMLWRPHAPLYPKLITAAPGGLKVHEAISLRKRGLKIMRLCILSKNGYYGDLVQHVREAFEDDELVRIDCKGLNTSDYKKIGSKLRDLVPCYLLSFDKEQIVLWKGRDKVSSSIDSNDSEETDGANVQHVEDGGGAIATVNASFEDVSSRKGGCDDVCEDVEKCQYGTNLSDEEAILSDSSDEDSKSSVFLKECIGAGMSDEDAEPSAVSECIFAARYEDDSSDDRRLAGGDNVKEGDAGVSDFCFTSEEDEECRV